MQCYLEHANITIRDLDEAVKFFTTVFPHFKVRGRGESDQGGWTKKWLHLGTDQIYVALEAVPLEDEGTRRPYRDRGINHIGFVVADVDAIINRLRAAGYRDGIAVKPHPHRKRAYFHDSEGNEYEFVEYLSEVPAERNDYGI
jgi:catechol 2,3-dioxygenase-like lactoylglutathione lyase family enzyme